MENKQQICNLLCETLKATRNHSDIDRIDYDAERETVSVRWIGGGCRNINVALDGGTAMIRDIMNRID